MACENGTHGKIVQDQFAKLPGVRRRVPGDCYCLDCKLALPADWNGGKPKLIEEPTQH